MAGTKRRMPSFKKKGKPYKKKFKKLIKAPSATKQATSVKLGKGLPKRLCLTHKYCETKNLTIAASTVANYVIQANGMFDPDITSTGHQPMYFDQIKNLYQEYTVIGAKITFDIICKEALTSPLLIAATVQDTSTPVSTSSLAPVWEQVQTPVRRIIGVGGSGRTSITLKWSARKFWGKNVLAQPGLSAGQDSNPERSSYFVIYVARDDMASSQVLMNIKVEQIAVWREVRVVSQS